jgi:hypothetical protein
MEESHYKSIVRHGWTLIPLFFMLIFSIDIVRGIFYNNITQWFTHEGNDVIFYKWGIFLSCIMTISFWIKLFNAKAFRWFIFGFTCLWMLTFILGPIYEFSQGIIPVYIFVMSYIQNVITAITLIYAYKWAKSA